LSKGLGKGLGKGLDALIPSLHINDDDKVVEIPLSQLRANPYQPRKHFDVESIAELASSIKEHGVIQPIIVRSVLKGYEIIAGERRFRATQKAGLPTIPAVVRNFTDRQVMEITLIENLQREDLNAMEIATAYQNLIDTFALTQEELSAKVGKSRSHIANFLRLLQLPPKIKEYVSRGTLSMGHARAIAGMKEEKAILELAELSIAKEWSVRELEDEIRKREQQQESTKSSPTKKQKRDPYIFELEESLREMLKTTVKIKSNKNKGKIEISYYSSEDLQRVLDIMQGKDIG
jgi:ParB family transcriptional regulator, chromosome partitioning protein